MLDNNLTFSNFIILAIALHTTMKRIMIVTIMAIAILGLNPGFSYARSSHYTYKPIRFKSIFKIPKIKTYKIKY